VPLAELAILQWALPGLAGVVKTLADELGPAGIRINGILPVRIATDRVRELDARSGDPDEVRRACLNTSAAQIRRARGIRASCRVPALPRRSYITGAMIPVDGVPSARSEHAISGLLRHSCLPFPGWHCAFSLHLS